MSSHKFFQVCPPSLCLKYFNFVPDTGLRRVTSSRPGNIISADIFQDVLRSLLVIRQEATDWCRTNLHWYYVTQCEDNGRWLSTQFKILHLFKVFFCRTCIVTIWSHILIIGLQLIFLFALLFLLKHFLEWRITSSGPLRLIAVNREISLKATKTNVSILFIISDWSPKRARQTM